MRLLAPHFEPYAGQKDEHTLLINALRQEGIEYLSWDAREGEMPEADAIFWQGISGYYTRMDRLEALLSTAEKLAMPSLNATALIRWNAHKTYLQEMEKAGVACLDTLWLEAYDEATIRTWAVTQGYDEIVVKPVISAGADRTFRLRVEEEWAECKEAYRNKTMLMAQPFAPEILTEGEWSFLFFGGEFSHAVRKTPKAGDYRIQHVHGGRYERVTPTAALLESAARVLTHLPRPPVYARVDGVIRQSEFYLMEIELIEPYFYLDAAPEKAAMFVRAVVQSL